MYQKLDWTPTRPNQTYFSKQVSDMYDKEPRFPFHKVFKSARIEYQVSGLSQYDSTRCDIVQISRAVAVLQFPYEIEVADQVTLDIPLTKLDRIGCVKTADVWRRRPSEQTIVTLRMLRWIDDAEIETIAALGKLEQEQIRANRYRRLY